MTAIVDNGFARVTKETLVRNPSTAGALTGDGIAYDSTNTINEKIDSIVGSNGTVTNVSSATSDATITNPTTTPEITIISAPKLTNARNINGVAFDGTANITISDSTKQPSDVGLTSLSGLTGTGYVKETATDTFALVTTIPNTDISGLGTLSTQSGTFSGTHSGTSSGTNTGDQTSIVGITGTKSQFDTAVTDGNIMYVGDAPTAHTQNLSTISDVTMTVANLNSLDDGVNTALHFHDADRARSAHTGTQSSTTISDFTEAAQDATGAMVDTSLIYTDATPLLQRAALTGAITASAGSNATSLGSFTTAQLNTALSDNDITTGGGTATGSNTGDNAVNSLYSGLVSNATHTGDATGSTALTVVKINGTQLSALGTGILKNTTGTGVPSIAVAGDFPTLNQSTTGNAATATNLTGLTTSVATLNLVSGTNTGNQTITNTSDATSHTATLSATGGSIKLVEGSNITLTTTGTGADGIVTIASTASGTGDVVGPASATNNGIVTYNGTTGKLVQSPSTFTASGAQMTIPALNSTTSSNSTILTNGQINFTGSVYRIIGDANYNELISFPSTSIASAVNEFTISNAATGTGPILEATGGNTNIDININPKGTGRIKSGTVAVPTISSTDTLTNKSISLGTNTVTGTLAQFNTACTDADFATGGGTATGSNTGDNSANTNSGLVHTTGNETLSGVKTFTDEVKITYGKGIFNDGFPTIPALKTEWSFADTGGSDSTRITPAGSAVTSNMVYSGAVRNGSKGDFYVEGKQTVTGGQVLGGTGKLLTVGDDASFYDVNIAGCIALKGESDATAGRLQLGTSAYIEGTSSGTLTLNGAVTARVNPRLTQATSYTTSVTMDFDANDEYDITAQAGALLFNNPSGTPVNGQKRMVRIKDSGTARALTYGTQFASGSATLLTTTVISKKSWMGFEWDSTDSKWYCIAAGTQP